MCTMGRVNVVLPDDVLKELRTYLPAKRGKLSEFVTQAVKEKIDREYYADSTIGLEE